jgi:hypothetical protein
LQLGDALIDLREYDRALAANRYFLAIPYAGIIIDCPGRRHNSEPGHLVNFGFPARVEAFGLTIESFARHFRRFPVRM